VASLTKQQEFLDILKDPAHDKMKQTLIDLIKDSDTQIICVEQNVYDPTTVTYTIELRKYYDH